MEKNQFPWQAIIIGVLCGLVAAGAILLASRPSRGSAVQLPEAPPAAGIMVDVSGAVVQPGVFELPPGSRVADAIAAAGGLQPEAFSESLNLAAPLADGTKVLVPLRPEESALEADTASANASTSNTTNYGAGFPININTASLNTLTALPGIGETKAQAIIDYRTEHGPFTNIEQLMDVSGIGQATFDKLKNLVTIY